MKKLTLVILATAISSIAAAKCADKGIYFLSGSAALNSNGLIVLEFYGSSQLLISELNKKYPIYLQHAREKVQLSVVEILPGEMRVTQVILKPISALQANETYSFHIDHLPKDESKPIRYNHWSERGKPLTFFIKPLTDHEPPVITGMPVEIRQTFVQYGCGPASWVYFSINGQDSSETFARVNVTNTVTGKTTTYILPVENGTVKVGHGMCSGGFRFNDGDLFEVTFQLVDQSGNTSMQTEKIKFSKPVKVTNEE